MSRQLLIIVHKRCALLQMRLRERLLFTVGLQFTTVTHPELEETGGCVVMLGAPGARAMDSSSSMLLT